MAIGADLIIVGNGGAAAEAVLALRANGYDGDIHLFADNVMPRTTPCWAPTWWAASPAGARLSLSADRGASTAPTG